MTEQILVTGFPPYSLTTSWRGNPSKKVASLLGTRYGSRACVETLSVDENGLTSIAHLAKGGFKGVLMLGADFQITQCVLELSGVAYPRTVHKSAFAESVQKQCIDLGMSVHSASFVMPGLGNYCLRSYAKALEAAGKDVPCAFVHLNALNQDLSQQTKQVSGLFDIMASEVWKKS